MSSSDNDSLLPLLPHKGDQECGRYPHWPILHLQDFKLVVIPNEKDPNSITHPGESSWWSRENRGIEKWVKTKALNPDKTIWKQKNSKLLSEKVRAVKTFLPGVMHPSRPGHRTMLRLLKISNERSDLFVQFFGWYEDRPGGNIFFSMVYFRDGNISNFKAVNYGKHMPEDIAISLAKKVLRGIRYLHRNGMFNLDLRPENILVADKKPLSIRISCFGISSGRAHGGHPIYQNRFKAPELMGLMSAEITKAVDIWALGCIIHEMLWWHTPFVIVPADFNDGLTKGFVKSAFAPSGEWVSPPEIQDLLPGYVKGQIPLKYEALQQLGYKISDRPVRFLKRIFVLSPEDRMSAAEALDDLWVFPPLQLQSNLQDIGVIADFPLVESFLKTYDPNDYFMEGTGLISALFTENHKNDIGNLVFRSVTLGFVLLTEMLLDVYRNSQVIQGMYRPTLEYFRVDRRIPGKVEHSIRFQSFLQRAAGLGNIRMVELLLRKNASKINEPHVPSYESDRVKQIGRTALQTAAENGHLEMVELLIERGADVANDIPCIQSGRTALQGAVENGHLSVVRFLLEKGANPNQEEARFNGCTAINAAVIRGDRKIFDLLLEYGAHDITLGLGFKNYESELVEDLEEFQFEDAVQPVSFLA